MTDRAYLSIGDVLTLLQQEFPDITISKIRFLESRGLLVPERTPSGYRKFYEHDVERLRWILRQQRENFLPLKVIKGRLDGQAPESEPASLFEVGQPHVSEEPPLAVMTRSSAAEEVGVPAAQNSVATACEAGEASEHELASVAARLTGDVDGELEANGSANGAYSPGGPSASPSPPSLAASRVAAAAISSSVAPSGVAGGGVIPRPVAGMSASPALSRGADPGAETAQGTRPPMTAAATPPAALQHASGNDDGGLDVKPQASAAEPPARAKERSAEAGAGPVAAATGQEADGPERTGGVAPRSAERAEAAEPGAPGSPSSAGSHHSGALDDASMTAAELAHASGLTIAQVEELESYGLIESHLVAGVSCFDESALAVAGVAAGFARFGVEARHLKIFKHAAERQTSLYSQIVMPLLRQRNPAARRRAHDDLTRLVELGASMQACFAKAALKDLTRG